LVRILSGFTGFPGAGLFPRLMDETLDWLSLRVGTVAPARNEGFLWVISLGSTFRKPLVTASPLFRSEKTAPKPLDAAAGAAGFSSISNTGAGPGGGGGGGGPPAAAGGAAEVCVSVTSFKASWGLTPAGFHSTPWGKDCLTYSARSLKI
jgi:hypothetical protein